MGSEWADVGLGLEAKHLCGEHAYFPAENSQTIKIGKKCHISDLSSPIDR